MGTKIGTRKETGNWDGLGTLKWREGGLIERDGGIWMKSEGAAKEHKAREVSHDRLRLNMEVAEHLVGAPVTDELNMVGVDVGAKQCHSASSMKTTGRNIGGEETEGRRVQGCHSSAEGAGDVSRTDRA